MKVTVSFNLGVVKSFGNLLAFLCKCGYTFSGGLDNFVLFGNASLKARGVLFAFICLCLKYGYSLLVLLDFALYILGLGAVAGLGAFKYVNANVKRRCGVFLDG